VRGLRRAALALGIGALLAAAVRVRGSGGTPPRGGGWRELSDEELRCLVPLGGEAPPDGRNPDTGP